MQHVEMVPGVRLKTNRGILLDRRNSLTKPRFIGLIMPNLEGSGYTFCPFVFQRLKFKSLPPIFQTPQSAANWISTQKNLVYLFDGYTIFNQLIYWLYLMPISLKTISHIRFSLICMFVPAGLITLFANPTDPVMFVVTKFSAVAFFSRSAFEFHLLRRDLKQNKEKY